MRAVRFDVVDKEGLTMQRMAGLSDDGDDQGGRVYLEEDLAVDVLEAALAKDLDLLPGLYFDLPLDDTGELAPLILFKDAHRVGRLNAGVED